MVVVLPHQGHGCEWSQMVNDGTECLRHSGRVDDDLGRRALPRSEDLRTEFDGQLATLIVGFADIRVMSLRDEGEDRQQPLGTGPEHEHGLRPLEVRAANRRGSDGQRFCAHRTLETHMGIEPVAELAGMVDHLGEEAGLRQDSRAQS